MEMKKGFKKGFTLVEMMIVVAIIAILAGVAIPQYTKYVRKSEAVEAVGFLKQIVDAESTYYASHNKFYVNTSESAGSARMEKTIKVLSLDNISGKFEYGVATDSNSSTILVRANKPGETNYIYMFFPSDNNSSINNYVADEWDNTVFTSDYVNKPATRTSISLQNVGNKTWN